MSVENPTQEDLRVLVDILEERRLQDGKWGIQHHAALRWLSILGEEYGEACCAANEATATGTGWPQYRRELVQVAAVAMAAIEDYDSRGLPAAPPAETETKL